MPFGIFKSAPSYEGGYSDPGAPGRDTLKFADWLRAGVIDFPLLVVFTAMLYNMAWVQNDESRSWGFGDVLMVILVAYALKQFALGMRWEGIL